MTNEEAIAIIRNEYKCVDRDCDIERSCGKCDLMMPSKEPILKAYEVAIQALPQEPCDEVVSRQAALNSLIDNTHLDGYDLAEALDAIENKEKLPPVTVQQKYGKWIEHPEIETSAPEYLMFYECSECGDKQCFCKSDIHKKRFCNNCGAKMVEPQESENKE